MLKETISFIGMNTYKFRKLLLEAIGELNWGGILFVLIGTEFLKKHKTNSKNSEIK